MKFIVERCLHHRRKLIVKLYDEFGACIDKRHCMGFLLGLERRIERKKRKMLKVYTVAKRCSGDVIEQ